MINKLMRLNRVLYYRVAHRKEVLSVGGTDRAAPVQADRLSSGKDSRIKDIAVPLGARPDFIGSEPEPASAKAAGPQGNHADILGNRDALASRPERSRGYRAPRNSACGGRRDAPLLCLRGIDTESSNRSAALSRYTSRAT